MKWSVLILFLFIHLLSLFFWCRNVFFISSYYYYLIFALFSSVRLLRDELCK